MRAPVGLLLIGLCLTACTKKEPPPPSDQDSQTQIGAADNGGPSLGDPTPQQPQGANQPVNGATPTKVISPVHPLNFGSIGAPTQGGNTQQPAGAPVQPGSTPASKPTTTPPVAAQPTTTTPPTTGGAVTTATGRGVPPPPGGRPKPGTK